MKIYDSKSKKKVEFVPREDGKVTMYVCGPTVYDLPHLGHGRSATCFDVIRRYFIFKGYRVKYVSNYTDIDDKMIKRAHEEEISVKELADKIIPEYEKDYGALGILPPDGVPKATKHIKEIVDIIKKIEEKGATYNLKDGVYFDVTEFPEYGELSHKTLEDLQAGARVEVNENKKSPFDFVLWKFKKEGEPSWPSPWGEGRPGWHIECSAMTFAHLGQSFDIHGGGLDLAFPHHECEVAQSMTAFGKNTFAKYWLHNGFINVDNEKMSKSLGNFQTLREIFEKFDPKVVRLMFLQTHYRNPINFSEKLLEQSRNALNTLHDFVRKLKIGYKNLPESVASVEVEAGRKMKEEFETCMDNDFDTSGALGAVYDFVAYINRKRDKGELTKEEVDDCKLKLKEVDNVLGIIFDRDNEKIDEKIQDLINRREKARKNKDFALADEIRQTLKKKGIELEDSANGTIWKKV